MRIGVDFNDQGRNADHIAEQARYIQELTHKQPSAVKGDVLTVLVQVWSQRLSDQDDTIAELRAQNIELREQNLELFSQNDALFSDMIDITTERNDASVMVLETTAENVQLQDLIIRMVSENPQLREKYRVPFVTAVLGNAENPIDLTTDDEMEEETLVVPFHAWQ